MTKNELRVIYREKRKKLTQQQLNKLQDLLLIQFQKLHLPQISLVHTYLASLKMREPETAAVIAWLEFQNPGLRIAVPRIDRHTSGMYHYLYDEQMILTPNEWGIREPAEGKSLEVKEIDLVLVPLLCFDKKGFRVGYGKGYYDRFLAHCRPDCFFIGLSFFDPVGAIDDVDSFDIPLHYCITPSRIYSFNS